MAEVSTAEVRIDVGGGEVTGDLAVPDAAVGAVAFAHGSGSSRHSRRNREVAATLQRAGLATLLMDLLTPEEEVVDLRTREHRFDIALLADRVAASVDWLRSAGQTRGLALGLFGASTGAAAALVAAAELPRDVAAVVSRGGRPDLAGDALPRVAAPTLLIVGGEDREVVGMNEHAAARMHSEVELEVVPGAGHLFEEPGALDRVAELARDHLLRRLAPA